MLQVIRSVRLIRVIHAFRELIFSILDTTRQLVWVSWWSRGVESQVSRREPVQSDGQV